MFILENGCVSTWKWPGVGGLPLCVCVCMCVFQYVWEGELYSHADGAWWTPYTFGFLAINKLTIFIHTYTGFPRGSEVKVSACNAGDPGSIPGSGRSPGEGNGNPLQDSCLENPMDREAWWATVHGILQAIILEWVAIPFSGGSSQQRDRTQISCIAGRFFISWGTRATYIYTPLLIKLKHSGWTLTCNCKIFGGFWV